MKVTIQYYDKDPKVKANIAAAVAKAAQAKGHVVDPLNEDWHEVKVPDSSAAKALMADLGPIPNIQIQQMG